METAIEQKVRLQKAHYQKVLEQAEWDLKEKTRLQKEMELKMGTEWVNNYLASVARFDSSQNEFLRVQDSMYELDKKMLQFREDSILVAV